MDNASYNALLNARPRPAARFTSVGSRPEPIEQESQPRRRICPTSVHRRTTRPDGRRQVTLNGEVRTLMAMHPMTPAGVVSGALAKVARLQQQAAARQQAGATSDPVQGPQLPPWELEQRGWPNPLARSALCELRMQASQHA